MRKSKLTMTLPMSQRMEGVGIWEVLEVAQDGFGGHVGGIGEAERWNHVVTHFFGEAAVIGEHASGEGGGFERGMAAEGAVVIEEHFSVAFFLAGNDVIDDGRGACSEDFMEDSASGFADDEIVGAQEVGHLVSPTDKCEPVFRQGVGEVIEGEVESAFVLADGQGQVGAGEDERTKGFQGCGNVFDGGGGEVQDGLRGVGWAGGREWSGEGGADGEAGDEDFLRRKVAIEKDSDGFGVGDAIEVAGVGSPTGVDGDGVGDDGEEGRDRALGTERGEKGAVEGVGADDGAGLMLMNQAGEGFLKGSVERVGLLADIAFGEFSVGPSPGAGEVDDGSLVSGLQNLGQGGQVLLEQVNHEDGLSGARQLSFQCLGNGLGGRVMAVSEACR